MLSGFLWYRNIQIIFERRLGNQNFEIHNIGKQEEIPAFYFSSVPTRGINNERSLSINHYNISN